jgi:hypothetical protein
MISDKRLCGDPTCSCLYIVMALLVPACCMLRNFKLLKITQRVLCLLFWILERCIWIYVPAITIVFVILGLWGLLWFILCVLCECLWLEWKLIYIAFFCFRPCFFKQDIDSLYQQWFPDIVFSKRYRLCNLQQVRRFQTRFMGSRGNSYARNLRKLSNNLMKYHLIIFVSLEPYSLSHV